MIRVEAIDTIGRGEAEPGHVPRHRIGRCIATQAITTTLETIAITAGTCKVGEVTVVESPAILESRRGFAIDAIETVVAVEPRATATNHIAGTVGGRGMDAE